MNTDVDQVADECRSQALDLAAKFFEVPRAELERLNPSNVGALGRDRLHLLQLVSTALLRSFLAGVDYSAARAGKVPR